MKAIIAKNDTTTRRSAIDEFDALGITWAAKLRRLDEQQQILAEDLINGVLSKAYFKELTRETAITNFSKPTSSSHISEENNNCNNSQYGSPNNECIDASLTDDNISSRSTVSNGNEAAEYYEIFGTKLTQLV